MIRKILAAVGAAAVLAGLSGCSLTEREAVKETRKTEVPPQMLFLGDSIAAGYGLEGYTAENLYNCPSYANILSERCTAELAEISCRHKMINEAVSGARSEDLLELLNSGRLDGALKDSDAIVISIGGNDMLQFVFQILADLGYSYETGIMHTGDIDLFAAAASLYTMEADIDEALAGFQDNLKEIADAVHDKSEGVLYIQTLYDPLEQFGSIPMLGEFSEEKIGVFNGIITDNAESGRYTVVDVGGAFKGRNAELTNIMRFDIHPNAQGHELIAELVDASFRETGFTCTEYTEGQKKLTASGIAVLAAVVVLLLGISMVIIIKITKREK